MAKNRLLFRSLQNILLPCLYLFARIRAMAERESRQQNQPDHDSVERIFQQKLLQSELISSGQVTLREVLNRKGRDPVGLLDVRANFQVRDAGTSIAYIASFPEDQASFGGERFIEVLREAKPVRQGREKYQGKGGILGDWQMLLKDKQESYSHKEYDHLLDEHTTPDSPITRKLREIFIEFEEEGHMKRFWDALDSSIQDQTSRRLEYEYSRLMTEDKAFAEYGLEFLRSNFEMFLKVIDKSKPQFKKKFLRFLKSRTNFDFHFNREVLSEAFRSKEKEDLITDFYSQLDEDKKKELVYTSTRLNNFPKNDDTVFVDKDGNADGFYDEALTKAANIHMSKLPNRDLQIMDGESYIRVAFVADERTGFQEPRIVERYLPAQEGEIAPVIIWETDKTTGKRSYFCGKISEELIRAFPDLFSQRHDTLLGQITVAAYSEYLKTKLPVELPLVKGGPRQDMLEGQMLAFVRLFAAAYLIRSPVINGLEASAASDAAAGKSDLATVV